MKRFPALAFLPALVLLSCKKPSETPPAASEPAAQAARVSPSPAPSSSAAVPVSPKPAVPDPAAQAARVPSSPNPLSLTPPSPGCGQEAPSALAPKPEDPPDSCGPR